MVTANLHLYNCSFERDTLSIACENQSQAIDIFAKAKDISDEGKSLITVRYEQDIIVNEYGNSQNK